VRNRVGARAILGDVAFTLNLVAETGASCATMNDTMKAILIPLALTLFSTFAAGQDEDISKGLSLYHACQAAIRTADAQTDDSLEHMKAVACYNYMSAVRDMLTALPTTAQDMHVCTTAPSAMKVTSATLARVYLKYMTDNPLMMDQWRLRGVLGAVKVAFPCP